jgi:ubiquitin-protein ligase
MSSVRLRRLQADYQKVQDFVRRHPRLQLIQTEGDPPERYQLQYQIRGLRQKDDRLVEVNTHLVEIALPRNYPRVPPQCRMLTPIFHPNIAPHAICIGDHWSAGESLSSIVARIGELIAYQSYNTKSPLNGEAARWTSENLDRLPLDPVTMVLEDNGSPPAGPPAPPPPDSSPAAASPEPAPEPEEQIPVIPVEPMQVSCPDCGQLLRIPSEYFGKAVRCLRCRVVFSAPPGDGAS